MNLFGVLRLPREILFGAGQRGALAPVVRRLGGRALVCTDARLAGEPVFAAMISTLEAAGVTTLVEAGVEPDVPRDSCTRSADAARGFRPDVVVGIGGGSCLDHAKTVAVLLAHGGTPDLYYGEHTVPGPVLPIVAVPTTAGTGSEATPVAVLSDPDKTMKVGIASPYILPEAAICDPELTLTCPRGLSAVAGADALTHAIEAFTAIRREPSPVLAEERVFIGKSAITDHFALMAIRLLNASLERACIDGSDLAARSDVMMGALVAGMAFGTAGTAAAHAIQYPIGAITHTPHGLGVACALPYVMAYNRAMIVPELAEIGRAMGLTGANETALVDAAIARVAGLFAAIGIPPNFRALGLADDKVDWVAEQAVTVGRLVNNNPRAIDAAAMTRLVRAAHAGDMNLD